MDIQLLTSHPLYVWCLLWKVREYNALHKLLTNSFFKNHAIHTSKTWHKKKKFIIMKNNDMQSINVTNQACICKTTEDLHYINQWNKDYIIKHGSWHQITGAKHLESYEMNHIELQWLEILCKKTILHRKIRFIYIDLERQWHNVLERSMIDRCHPLNWTSLAPLIFNRRVPKINNSMDQVTHI